MKKATKQLKFFKYLGLSLGSGGAIIIMTKIIVVLLYNENISGFFWFQAGGLLFLMFLYLLVGYMASMIIKMQQKLKDIYISDEGINLPFPYDRKLERNFLRFKDIERIVVVKIESSSTYRIVIYYKQKIRKDLRLRSDRFVISLPRVEAERFINAIKQATNGNLPIEHKKAVMYGHTIYTYK